MGMHNQDLRSEPEMPSELRATTDRGDWDKVDEATWESFPASDPPGRAPTASECSLQGDCAMDGDALNREARPGQKLLRRLTRELFQTETSARLHCRREAERLGDTPPAAPLRESAAHADASLKSLSQGPLRRDLPLSVAGALVGVAFSTVREFFLDRLLTSEQSYRGTLLGMKHGVDLVKMLNQLAQREGDFELVEWTDAWLRVREPLIQQAEASMSWFADHIAVASRVARPLLGRARA